MMVLIAILPLAAGLLLPYLKLHGRATHLYAFAVTLVTSLIVWAMMLFGSTEPLTLFSVTDAFVCRFAFDKAGSVYLGIASLLWPFSVVYASGYMGSERENTFFGFYTVSYAAAILLACADDLFTLYICFELLTLATLPLVMHSFNHASFRAARKYLFYLFGGGALALTGLVVISFFGSTDFIPGGALKGTEMTSLLRAMYLLCFFGFGAKAAVFPLSFWLPAASAAPTPVTALLHAVAVVNAGVFCVIRVTYSVFGADALTGTVVQYIAVGFSAFTLIWAGVLAVREQHFKRRLAWSTVANLSYMLGAITLMSETGLSAGMTHMAFHSLMKLVLFFAAGAVLETTGREYLWDLPGLARRMPWTFGCFTVAGLALTGVPPLIGFLSKYRLVSAGLDGGTGGALYAASVLLSSVLCALYILPIVIEAWFYSGDAAHKPVPNDAHEADRRMVIPMAIVTGLIVLLSLYPTPVLNYLDGVAASLMEVIG